MTFLEYKSAYWLMPASYRMGDGLNTLPTQAEMYDAVDGFIADCAFDLVKEYEVCPSSLDEHGLPMTYGETAHKRDTPTGACNECGQDPLKK